MQYYLHQVPGRLRVRIPAVRSNPCKAGEVKRLLEVQGVRQVEVNQLTGSVVIYHDPDQVRPEHLLQILDGKGYYDSRRAITCDEQIQRASHKAAARVGRAFFGWAVGKALESSGLSLLAVII